MISRRDVFYLETKLILILDENAAFAAGRKALNSNFSILVF